MFRRLPDFLERSRRDRVDGGSRRDGERDRSGRLRPARGGAALADKPGVRRHHPSGNRKGIADRYRGGTGTSAEDPAPGETAGRDGRLGGDACPGCGSGRAGLLVVDGVEADLLAVGREVAVCVDVGVGVVCMRGGLASATALRCACGLASGSRCACGLSGACGVAVCVRVGVGVSGGGCVAGWRPRGTALRCACGLASGSRCACGLASGLVAVGVRAGRRRRGRRAVCVPVGVGVGEDVGVAVCVPGWRRGGVSAYASRLAFPWARPLSWASRLGRVCAWWPGRWCGRARRRVRGFSRCGGCSRPRWRRVGGRRGCVSRN